MIAIWILLGVLIGWLTKIPFLLKWYKEMKEREIHASSLYDRALDLYIKNSKNENK